MPKAAENKKKISTKPSQGSLGASNPVLCQRERDYLVSVSKTDLLAGAIKIKENQVLGSPLTVSTRRVEPTTSKATVFEEVPMLAKSRFEEGAKTRSHKEEFLKKLLPNSLEHFKERREQMAWCCVSILRVFHKDTFIGKP